MVDFEAGVVVACGMRLWVVRSSHPAGEGLESIPGRWQVMPVDYRPTMKEALDLLVVDFQACEWLSAIVPRQWTLNE